MYQFFNHEALQVIQSKLLAYKILSGKVEFILEIKAKTPTFFCFYLIQIYFLNTQLLTALVQNQWSVPEQFLKA